MQQFTGTKFDDIYKYTKGMTVQQKGDIFEEFTYNLFKYEIINSGNYKSSNVVSNVYNFFEEYTKD